MNFGTTPPGGFMGKREPQTILKTGERKVVLDSASAANSLPDQRHGMRTGSSSKATSSRSRPGQRSMGADRSAQGPAPAPEPVQHYFQIEE
jgi:hypothetical protein